MKKKSTSPKGAAPARKPKAPKKASAKRAATPAKGAVKGDKALIAALLESPLAVTKSDKSFKAVLKVLQDTSEAVAVRLAALQSLQAASFSSVAFEGCRPDYLTALRSITSDADPEIRQRSLGLLAREKDGYAQKKLLEGLKKPERALVPPEKALQLLSYDPHADAYAAAREIVATPPNATARREALKLLSADTGSAPLFEKILGDKGETPEIRRTAASALHALNPGKLQTAARKVVMDPSEHGDVRSTCLTALANFGDEKALSADTDLIQSVEDMGNESHAAGKKSAKAFLVKYRG